MIGKFAAAALAAGIAAAPLDALAVCATPLTERVNAFYRAYEAIDVNALVDYATENVVFVDPTLPIRIEGRAALREAAEQLRVYQSYRFERLDTLADGDRVVVHQRVHVVRSGRPAVADITTYFRFEGCAIAEFWDFTDYSDMRRLQRELTVQGQEQAQ